MEATFVCAKGGWGFTLVLFGGVSLHRNLLTHSIVILIRFDLKIDGQITYQYVTINQKYNLGI